MKDRATYDDDHLDEVVIHNATVHIESLDAHNWMIMITRGTEPYEVYAHFNAQNITESDDMIGVPCTVGPPLLICSEWQDRKGVRHMCTRKHGDNRAYTEHKCDCGARHEGRLP